MRKIGIALGLFLLLVFLAGIFCTPGEWKWTKSNLQVRLHNLRNERLNEGSAGESAYWSKLDIICSGRDFGQDAWRSGRKPITSSSEMHIAGVSHGGVWVRVRYEQKSPDGEMAFKKLLFVPARGTARLDVSPDIYLTGAFE